MSSTDPGSHDWALTLYRHSTLKQEKLRRIVGLLDDPEGKTCLDIGGDNGVISYLLRQLGGRWYSADLDQISVESIRRLVGTGVERIDGRRTPFPDHMFDQVVIVDFLEHIRTDAEFVAELRRILRPGGTLIVNVPNLKRRSFLTRVRNALGLTDEKHGHVRAGYDLTSLRRLLGGAFRLEETQTYSRTFSELIDIGLNFSYECAARLKGKRESSKKGTVVTEDTWKTHRAEFSLLRAIYPLMWILAKLDVVLVGQEGYKLIVKATLQDIA